jgi:DNA repair protein RecO (recombination protein O)
LFRLLLETLRRLATRDDLDLALRYFEVQLLDELGYRPQLDRCVSCEAALAPTTNFWSAAGGGVLCPACAGDEPLARALSLGALKVLRLLQRGGFADAARVRIQGALAQELERHLREYIRYVLERDVRSIGFVDAVRRQAASSRRPTPSEAG